VILYFGLVGFEVIGGHNACHACQVRARSEAARPGFVPGQSTPGFVPGQSTPGFNTNGSVPGGTTAEMARS